MNDFLVAIIAALSGGGLSTLILLPITKKKYQAEAMKEVQDVYQETVADLRNDKRLMKEELSALSGKMMQMSGQLDKNTIEIEGLKKNECTRLGCSNRLKS